MNKLFLLGAFAFAFSASVQAQNSEKTSLIGWFITSETGVLFLEDHTGNSVGASFGIKVWKNRLKLGIHAYGRSGPINPKTFTIEAHDGQSYKGSSTLTLRADWSTVGVLIAPTFKIKKMEIDVPSIMAWVPGASICLEMTGTPPMEQESVHGKTNS